MIMPSSDAVFQAKKKTEAKKKKKKREREREREKKNHSKLRPLEYRKLRQLPHKAKF